MAPLALAGFALLFTPSAASTARSGLYRAGAALAAVLFVIGFGLAFVPHGVVRPSADIAAYTAAKVDNAPANWTAYGRTTAGLRYSPFDLINRGNVGNLEPAWTYRTGRGDIGIGNSVFHAQNDTNSPMASRFRFAPLFIALRPPPVLFWSRLTSCSRT